jgi:hypothetical protein
MINHIIDQINFHDLFVSTITSNFYCYIEIWFEDGEIELIARPQNEYAQNEDGLVARIKTTRGENEFLFDGYATFSDGKYIIMETGEEINESELIQDCLENGDWSMVYDDLENQIRDQYQQLTTNN